jgi:hypothetical protein
MADDAWKDRRDVLWMQAESSDPDVALSAKLELRRFDRPWPAPPEQTIDRDIQLLEWTICSDKRALFRARRRYPDLVGVQAEMTRCYMRRLEAELREKQQRLAELRRQKQGEGERGKS